MKQNEFLSSVLSPEHRAAGLHLQEDDHFVILFHEETEVAEFTGSATVDNILREADQWLNQQKSGIVFSKAGESIADPVPKGF